MKFRHLSVATITVCGLLATTSAFAQKAKPKPVKNIVLVHGAFADSTSWDKLIPLLEAKGLHVATVDIPLTSFTEDVTLTKKVIAEQNGPVLLVAHSYGGAVITEAGDEPKVAGLVYLAAMAPKDGQTLGGLGDGYPKPAGLAELRPQPNGFLRLTDDGIRNYFAADLAPADKDAVVAHQIPFPAAGFGVKLDTFAWKTKPTWYVVSTNDQIIDPQSERDMAKTIGAKEIELPSSHVVMLSHPKEIAQFIEGAAKGH